jgi:uncharacterized membrane protein
MVTLRHRLPGEESLAHDVNAAGTVVAVARSGDGILQAYAWDGARALRLPSLDGGYAEAFAINDTGDIVGVSGSHSVLWRPHPGRRPSR